MSLRDLVTANFYLILGAGASVDYGFPLWSDLKDQMILKLAMIKNRSSDWWLRQLEDNRTVDQIAFDSDDDHFNLFRSVVAEIILEAEIMDFHNRKQGWVEDLAPKMAKLLFESDNPEQVIYKLKIINFNYDRSFPFRFRNALEQELSKFLPLNKKRDLKRFKSAIDKLSSVYYPHGVVGLLNTHKLISTTWLNDEPSIIAYGSQISSHTALPNVFPVNELKKGRNVTYEEINNSIPKSSVAMCIGMSELGILESQLKWDRFRNIFYSGDIKIDQNFIPMHRFAADVVNVLEV